MPVTMAGLPMSLASDQQGNRSVSCLRRRPPVSRQMTKLESAFDLAGNMYAPPQKLPLPKIINLLRDRRRSAMWRPTIRGSPIPQ